MRGELIFNEAEHSYALDGVRLPSVTKIIQAVLPMPPVDEWYLTRGTATHKACELADGGRLAWESVDAEILPRVEAWQKFRRDFPAKVIANEERMAHSVYRFAGTVDRVLDGDDGPIVCDLKNSVTGHVFLQLGGYSLLWKHTRNQQAAQAVAVELTDAGTYRTHWLKTKELRRAEQQFLALLTVYGFASEHKILKD